MFPVNFAKFLRTPFFEEHLWMTVSETWYKIFILSFHDFKDESLNLKTVKSAKISELVTPVYNVLFEPISSY